VICHKCVVMTMRPCTGRGVAIDDHRLGPMRATPPLIVWMSFRLAIPWRGALQRCQPPLHQPLTSLR
jgi:hypothetical protein